MRISDWSSDVCSSDLKRGASGSSVRKVSQSCASIFSVLGGKNSKLTPISPARSANSGEAAARRASARESRIDVMPRAFYASRRHRGRPRSEEHTSELQSLKRISNAVFGLKKKKKLQTQTTR